ncbi:hypothetical protein [Nautilia sp.]
MELVYLWVERYKNIENQGFNLSPKFRCEFKPKYKENGELDEENSELIIEENKNYVHIFPDNINVTAIVGKNGSGKSSIIKLIYKILFMYYNKNLTNSYWEDEETHIATLIRKALIDLVEKEFKLFLIVKHEKEFFKIDSEYLKKQLQQNRLYKINRFNKVYYEYQINNGKIENYKNSVNIFSIYYNYSLDTWQDGESLWVETIYHRKDDYKIPLLLEPLKKYNEIKLNLLKYLTNQRILLFYSFLKDELINNKITSFFNPDRIKFKYSTTNTIYKEELKKDGKTLKDLKFYPYKNLIKYINLKKLILNNNSFVPSNEIKQAIEKYYQENNLKILNLIYILFKIIEKKENLKEFGSKIEWLEEKVTEIATEKDFKKLINILEKCLKKHEEKLDSLNKDNYELKKIIVAIKFHQKKLYKKLEKFIEKKEISIDNLPEEDILEYFPAWLDVEFYENEKSLESLSTGEKFKFQFLIGLLYQLYNLKSKKYSTINIFLDEIELGFHPEWQKNYISEILFTLDEFKKMVNFDKKIHLFFLTHSPFIISDLPKQNIIFLDKDKNGKCKVVDGLNEKKETFGANIHTLLSDSFFMENGLMGEFASGIIDNVINYLNGKKSKIKSDTEAQKIINIIGEPIIKKELQRMLDSKRLKKINSIDEKIKLLEYELEILKEHQTKNIKNELLDRAKRKYFLEKKDEENNNNR